MGRAECVMLNKGPYILDAMRALDDILRRMVSIRQEAVRRCARLKVMAATAGAGRGRTEEADLPRHGSRND